MKRKNHRSRFLGVVLICLAIGWLSSCAVQSHAQAGKTGVRNKSVATADTKSQKPMEEKRKKVVKTSATSKKNNVKEEKVKVEANAAVAAEAPKTEASAPPARTVVPKLDYRLGYGDVLDIKFLGSSEYNETVTVRPDGKISLQVVGDIDVLGLTPMELDTLITNTYARILVNPDVAVIVKAFGGQRCYVAGEVERPGIIDMAKGMTLMRAIAAAGGHKKTGKLSSVILIRLDENGRAEARRVDLSFGTLAKNLSRDLPVHANDIIYVPRTFIADLNAFMSQIYELVLPPFDSYARFYYFHEMVNDK